MGMLSELRPAFPWSFPFLLAAACQAPLASPPAVAPAPAPEALLPPPALPAAALPPAPASVPFAEFVRKAQETYALAFKNRDAKKIAALYADDACIKAPGRSDVCGRASIAEASEALWAMFPDARTAWSRALLKGDLLVVESAWTGTNDGAAAGRKPTHKIVGAAVLALSWLLPDGRIREQHVYSDEGSIAMQLGTGATGRPFDGLPTTRERVEAKGGAAEDANAASLRDSATSVASFSDSAELVDFAHPGSLPEKKGAAKWIGLRPGSLSTPLVWTHVFGMADAVVGEYEATGKSNGKLVPLHGVEVFEIKDAKVSRAVRYRDSLESSPLPWLPLPAFSLGS
jgi:ketosteroid isomerase-like protein